MDGRILRLLKCKMSGYVVKACEAMVLSRDRRSSIAVVVFVLTSISLKVDVALF